MSAAETRTRIADLLALSVEDPATGETYKLDPRPFEPPTITSLMAWPTWTATSWLTRCALEQTWAVLVTLPAGDTETWTNAAEALIAPVRDALENVGHVSEVEPVTVSPADSGAGIPTLRFTFTISVS